MSIDKRSALTRRAKKRTSNEVVPRQAGLCGSGSGEGWSGFGPSSFKVE